MSTLRLRVEARQPLKRFRLADVPEFIRHRAALRDAPVHARQDGLWGAVALDYAIEAKRAAMFPWPEKHDDDEESDGYHYVSREAWDSMMAEAARMLRTGSYKNWMPE